MLLPPHGLRQARRHQLAVEEVAQDAIAGCPVGVRLDSRVMGAQPHVPDDREPAGGADGHGASAFGHNHATVATPRLWSPSGRTCSQPGGTVSPNTQRAQMSPRRGSGA